MREQRHHDEQRRSSGAELARHLRPRRRRRWPSRGQLSFDAYVFQLSVPIGTTTFPKTTGQGVVALYNGNDSTQEWSMGSRVSSTAAGTVTLNADGKTGTVDADMVPDTPRPNPALKPIHVKGTFACP